ncbi:MAG TPA: PspC domain-containing protein [Mycobacteriales bacterium]|nr:PspC domain-containing protein [Mycobacteriales bacterium]
MTETPVLTEPEPAPSPSHPPVRRFLRSRDERWIGGVCGGIADYFAVDVLLVRIVVVALTFFGGVGVAAYIAAWLLVPDGSGPSPAEKALRRRSRNVTGVVLVVLAALVLTSAFHHIWWWTPAPLFAFALLAGAIVVLRRRAARIAVASVLVLLLAGTVTVLAAGRSLSSRSVTVANAGDLDDEYDLGVGTLTLDLTKLGPITSDRDVTVHVGSGKARILLPGSIATHVDARTGVGSVEVVGDDAHGFGPSRSTDVGISPAGSGRLILEVRVGVGDADVTAVPPA